MVATEIGERIREQQAAIPLQRRWPQLGRELFTLECALTEAVVTYDTPLTEQEKMERKDRIKGRILAQLYRDEEKHSRDARYRAFLVVQKGRAAEIVGHPYHIDNNGTKRELPYTGLEGYYAGSERTSDYPGLMPEAIIQEEAQIGAALLRTLKKRSIEKYTWARFAKLKKALECGEPGVEDLRNIVLLWAQVVTRLRVRVYHNQEFEATISEQMEQVEKLLGGAPARTKEEKEHKSILQAEYQRLKNERNKLSEEEKEDEREERRKRESIRGERLRAYNHFREQTYDLLKEAGKSEYAIRVRDANWTEATIIETIRLPKTGESNDFTSIEVRLTPEQLEGYLFLAQLGEIGGDPLARSVLISNNTTRDLP
jgi:hypothetical protein